MKFFALIAFIPLVACNACGSRPQIDAALKPMLDQYLSLAPDQGNLDELVSLQFGEPPGFDNGTCVFEASRAAGVAYSTKLTIVIRKRSANSGAPMITTVFHELGHCLHGLQHTDGAHDIMNPARDWDADYWRDNLESATRAMFEGAK